MNHIDGLTIHGVEVRNKENLREKVPNYYKKLYQEPCDYRPKVDDLPLDRISMIYCEELDKAIRERNLGDYY